MKKDADYTIFTHLDENAAHQLAMHQSEVLAERPELIELNITDENVEMPVYAAFDLLYQYDRKLWEDVLDAFIEIAQEKFFEHHDVDPDDRDSYYLENGVDFSDGAISVSR